MGILDSIFSGVEGITKTMAATLGGAATIIYVTKVAYNAATDSYNDTYTERNVSFLPESGARSSNVSYATSEGGYTTAGGVKTDKDTISGTVPYCDIDIIPTPDLDRIRVGNVEYSIYNVGLNRIGDSIVSVSISGRRI